MLPYQNLSTKIQGTGSELLQNHRSVSDTCCKATQLQQPGKAETWPRTTFFCSCLTTTQLLHARPHTDAYWTSSKTGNYFIPMVLPCALLFPQNVRVSISVQIFHTHTCCFDYHCCFIQESTSFNACADTMCNKNVQRCQRSVVTLLVIQKPLIPSHNSCVLDKLVHFTTL